MTIVFKRTLFLIILQIFLLLVLIPPESPLIVKLVVVNNLIDGILVFNHF